MSGIIPFATKPRHCCGEAFVTPRRCECIFSSRASIFSPSGTSDPDACGDVCIRMCRALAANDVACLRSLISRRRRFVNVPGCIFGRAFRPLTELLRKKLLRFSRREFASHRLGISLYSRYSRMFEQEKHENPTVGSRDFAESVEMYFIKRAAQNSARVGRLIATSGAFKAAFCYTFAVSRSLSLSSLSLSLL